MAQMRMLCAALFLSIYTLKAIVITPKNDDEFKFVASLLKKLGVHSALLSQEDLEDIGLSGLMRRVDKRKKAGRSDI